MSERTRSLQVDVVRHQHRHVGKGLAGEVLAEQAVAPEACDRGLAGFEREGATSAAAVEMRVMLLGHDFPI